MDKKNVLIIVLVGAGWGLLQYFFSYFSFIAAVLICFYWFIRANYERSEAGFLIRVTQVSFLLLIPLGFLGVTFGPVENIFHLPSSSPDRFLFGDGEWMYRAAYNLNMMSSGRSDLTIEIPYYKIPLSGYGFCVQLYLMAFLFNIFQFDAFLPVLTNIIFFNITGVLMYALSRRLFCLRTARINCLLFLFFPSMMIWAVSSIKEPTVIFMTVWLIHLFFKHKDTRRWGRLLSILLMVLLVWGLSFSRAYLGLLILAVMSCVSLAVNLTRRLGKRRSLAIVGLFLLVSAVYYKPYLEPRVNNFFHKSFEVHRGAALSRGFGYRFLGSPYYASPPKSPDGLKDYLIVSVKAVWYFMFSPFPFDTRSKFLFLATLPMLYWYFLCVLAVYGASPFVRRLDHRIISLLFMVFFIVYFYGLHSGNSGTVFRHRDMVTPIILLFSGEGIRRVFFRERTS